MIKKISIMKDSVTFLHWVLITLIFTIFLFKVQLPGMKWVDGHKGVFNCSVHTESSVHTQVFLSLISILWLLSSLFLSLLLHYNYMHCMHQRNRWFCIQHILDLFISLTLISLSIGYLHPSVLQILPSSRRAASSLAIRSRH